MLSLYSLINIESFSENYREQVISLIVNIQQKEYKIPITTLDQPDLLDIPDYYQKAKGNFWVALHQEKVVGTISLLDIGKGQGALRKMFVDKNFRGPKYGTAQKLLEELISWAKSKEINHIFLGTTPRFLAAHRFYEKNGFTEIPREQLPDTFPIMKVDTKFYKYVI